MYLQIGVLLVALVVTTHSYLTADENTGRKFECHVNRSHSTPPTSVHALRPEDVRVIAAIGDSLTAGMGIYSKSLFTIFTQYRGHSFTMGGAESLKDHATCQGFSTGISGPDGIYAHLNVAVVGDKAENLPYQARKIVKRMKETQGINFDYDWKIINVFIGGNDICDYCKDVQRSNPEKFRDHIIEALDYLQEHVPRAFVNLMQVVNASVVNDLTEQGLKCKALLSTFWCKCPATRPKAESNKYVEHLQQMVREVVADDRYNKKDDFTVVLQPFFLRTHPPEKKPGVFDMSYLAPDCFHFAAPAHAEAAVALWNNMMEPIGKKQTAWKLGQRIKCPTGDQPYFCTSRNCGAEAEI